MFKQIFPTIILISLAIVSCRNENNEETPREYEIIKIVRQNLDNPELYSATIRGSQDIDIFPQVAGIITRVCVKEGQRVKEGDILFIIDQVPYQAALRRAKANVKAAKAKVEKARLDLESKRFLLKENVISEYELSVSKNELSLAEAELDQMVAQELDDRNSLSYTEVKSPVNGVIGTLPYRIGSLVSPTMDKPLTTVSENAVMNVYFSISENRWRDMIRAYGSPEDAIKNIPEVRLRLNDGSLYCRSGKLVSASGIVNQQTGSVSIRCEFPNQNGELMSGSIGNIIFPNNERNVIVIPQRVANELQDKKFVYKVERRGKVHIAKAVEIKADEVTDGKHYVVRSGLAAGDTIIANGVGLLRDGMEITIAEEKE